MLPSLHLTFMRRTVRMAMLLLTVVCMPTELAMSLRRWLPSVLGTELPTLKPLGALHHHYRHLPQLSSPLAAMRRPLVRCVSG